MPSTRSTVVSMVLPSSTVITPSLPTFSIAMAIILPASLSLLAAIAATCSISLLPLTGTLSLRNSSTTASVALRMPRLSAIGSAPAVTFLRPSTKTASARTVAVVVPSPAMSLVLLATSLTILAPMFSTGSRNSISWATVTPSLVTAGPPQPLSSTALRPLGPRVDLTARASF